MKPADRPRPEARAKAALLAYMLEEGSLTEQCSIVSELTVAQQSNRADLVLINHELTCFEIKTRNDKLVRLDQQLAAFSRSFDRVSVVAATRHINTVLSVVPDHVGLLEITEFHGSTRVQAVRQSSPSPMQTTEGLLDLVPAVLIRDMLPVAKRPSRRKEMVERLAAEPRDVVREAVVVFLRDRYAITSQALKALMMRKDISAEDITMLRAWNALAGQTSSPVPAPTELGDEHDEALYRHVGRSFGPVPEEILALLSA